MSQSLHIWVTYIKCSKCPPCWTLQSSTPFLTFLAIFSASSHFMLAAKPSTMNLNSFRVKNWHITLMPLLGQRTINQELHDNSLELWGQWWYVRREINLTTNSELKNWSHMTAGAILLKHVLTIIGCCFNYRPESILQHLL